MLYEIINPSDRYTIVAESLDVAFVACLFLGSGQYAFKPLADGGEEIPIFMLGGCEEWCQEHFSESLEVVVGRITADPTKRAELAECLDSCLIGGETERETYHAALTLIDDPVKCEQWRAKWHADRLSSLNDIGTRAAKLRVGAGDLVPAPQQVFAS